MRAINALGLRLDEKLTGVENCLWGPNRDNGLVTATARNAQRIGRIERVVYGLAGAAVTVLVAVITSIVTGVI
jgi:hypothetical protein